MNLEELGWDAGFAALFADLSDDSVIPARVTLAYAREALVRDTEGEFRAAVSGKVWHGGMGPAVGDWVAVRRPVASRLGSMEAILPRRSVFTRRAPGTKGVVQVLAANVDVAFVVMGLDGDYNVRRLERFLTVTHASGASAVVVLSKADLVDDLDECMAEVTAVARGAPVVAARLLEEVPEALRAQVTPGRTAVLLGSSGVGKSTLINGLLRGDVQKIGAVRASDQRGRHTTTHRQLFAVPGGGLVIDSPGLREIQLWDADQGLGVAFDDVERLAPACKFRDCRHEGEPGCAVLAAVEDGRLPPERLASYHKLFGESERQMSHEDAVQQRKLKQANRVMAKALRTRIVEKKR